MLLITKCSSVTRGQVNQLNVLETDEEGKLHSEYVTCVTTENAKCYIKWKMFFMFLKQMPVYLRAVLKIKHSLFFKVISVLLLLLCQL